MNNTKNQVFLSLLMSLLIVGSSLFGVFNFLLKSAFLNDYVYARSESDYEEEDKEDSHEDKEDEHEEEDEDDHKSNDDTTEYEYEEYVVYTTPENPVQTSTKTSESKPVTTQVVETVPVITYVTVVDNGYNVDTDGDGLVDALDPNPEVHQKEFFTDSDGDGVADAYDRYPGEDDFHYIQFQDDNNNGILDFLE